jgi:alcohol dehydrogenase (cytochrome c)/quinohemoprotein ethanol dehydrogenase
VWDAIVYDPVTDLLYFGTGNGTPWNDHFRDPTSGDNLYLASIIAVKADTGEYVWHYQTVPAETWDYDAASPLMVVNLTWEGSQRRVILQPCKNGFFYVLDAASGKLLSAKPFLPVNWADGVDMKTGRPRVRPEARYVNHPWNLYPGVQGAHGWQANAYSPQTGLIYFPTQDAYFPMVPSPSFTRSDTSANLGIDFDPAAYYKDHPKEPQSFQSYLQAWDPVTGKTVWEADASEGATGGALATASGLVFHSAGSHEEIRAYDAKTGEKLWAFKTQTGALAPPISFELHGQQYIAVSVGGATTGGYYAPNYSRMLVFGLGGKVVLPATRPYTPQPLDPPPSTASAQVIQAGGEKFAQLCAGCHGDRWARGGLFPDLTRTPMLRSQPGFESVVLGGALSANGMASFASALSREDTVAIREYLIARANEIKRSPPPDPAPAVSQPHQ